MSKILLFLVPLLLAACEADAPCEPRALNILLTNDDGFDKPGIIALHRALLAAGHQVKRIAPRRNYSGSSAALTFDAIIAPWQPDEEFDEVYKVGGSPATAVVFGASALFGPDEPLELVVSGINNGANLGPSLSASGTVGAIIAGMRLVQPAVPGIAISTDRLSADVTPEQNEAHVRNVADFLVRLIKTAQCSEKTLFDSGQALNVNYPRAAPAEIKGVRAARQGQAQYLRFSFAETAEEQYEFQLERLPAIEDAKDSDVMLHRQGFITLVPIDADYSAKPGFDTKDLLQIQP